jgi:hypothetical protein
MGVGGMGSQMTPPHITDLVSRTALKLPEKFHGDVKSALLAEFGRPATGLQCFYATEDGNRIAAHWIKRTYNDKIYWLCRVDVIAHSACGSCEEPQ